MSNLATQSLQKILASGEYECVRGVAVFDEHERKNAAGEIINKVGRETLEEICRNNNRRAEETGDLSPIGPGHTIPSERDETKQPKPWGYAANWRVEPFGPEGKLAATVDFYIRREVQDGDKAVSWRDALSTYPRRSVEYFPRLKLIDWIALLRRTPERDLGLLTFSRDETERLYYSMEQPTMPDPVAPPDAMAPDQDFTDKVMRCLTAIPGFTAFLQQLAAQPQPAPAVPKQNAAAPAAVAPTNTAPPVPAEKKPDAKPDDEATRMQRESEAIRYARDVQTLQAEVKSLREAREADLLRYARSESERIVTQLEAEGYVLDRAKEVERFAKLDEAQRTERANEVRQYYRQDATAAGPPTGPMLHIGDRERGADQMDEAKTKQVLHYMRQHEGVTFEAATAAVLKKAQ